MPSHMKPGALPQLPRGHPRPRLPARPCTPHRTTARALHARAQPSSRATRPNQPNTRNTAHGWQLPTWRPESDAAVCLPPFACGHTWRHRSTRTRTASPHLCSPFPPASTSPPKPASRTTPPFLSYLRSPLALLLCALRRSQHAGHSCTCPASRAQRVGGRILARTASGCRLSHAATPGLPAYMLTGLAAEHSRAVLLL